MTKIIVIGIILTLVIYLLRLAFNYGKEHAPKNTNVKYNQNIDEMIKDIKAEIERLEKSSPEEIKRRENEISDLKAELERIQTLKNKFN